MIIDDKKNRYDHSSIYNDFIPDYRYDDKIPFTRYPDEYSNERIIKLCCSQHSKVVDFKETISDYKRKKITESWVTFLNNEKLSSLKEVQVCTKMSQKVFDALCNQNSIESLRIKWFEGLDINQISKLNNLKKLFIECAPRLVSVEPLAKLPNLQILILGDTKKVTDYEALGVLKNVEVFSVCSYPIHENIMHMDDDSFMFDMDSLTYVDMCDVQIDKQIYLTPENLGTRKLMALYRYNKKYYESKGYDFL